MSAGTCAAPISFPALMDYWLGELAPEREASVEEHLFGCAGCTRRLEELAALASGIRAAFRGGAVHAVISPALLEAMKNERLRLREYRVSPGGSVQCTIHATDDFVVSRLQAVLTGVKRLDFVNLENDHEPLSRLEDIPFDAAAGEVLFCPSPAALKKMPAYTKRVRLVAVDEAGDRTIGDYRFIHTPESGL